MRPKLIWSFGPNFFCFASGRSYSAATASLATQSGSPASASPATDTCRNLRREISSSFFSYNGGPPRGELGGFRRHRRPLDIGLGSTLFDLLLRMLTKWMAGLSMGQERQRDSWRVKSIPTHPASDDSNFGYLYS